MFLWGFGSFLEDGAGFTDLAIMPVECPRSYVDSIEAQGAAGQPPSSWSLLKVPLALQVLGGTPANYFNKR